MLKITKEQFRQIYKDTSVLAYEEIFFTEPKDENELKYTYMTSKLWRLNNLYTIIDKYGALIKFNMNLSQHKVYAASLKHPRLIILKSRQQGISTLWLVSFFDDACTKSNLSIGLMAQGQDEASTLLTRTKTLWDNLAPQAKRFFGINIQTDNTKELGLSNKCSIFVRTSFRSATLQRLHVSEMGKIANNFPEKAAETKTGTLQAIAPSNPAIIESTAEGDNMFKDMWDAAISIVGPLASKDFLAVFLSWIDDPDCVEPLYQHASTKQEEYFAELEEELGITLTQEQKNFWIVQYRELGDRIYQEYPSTYIEAFMATKDGAYYAKTYLNSVKGCKREVSDLYDKNLPVQVAFDLGMNDTNVATIFQKYRKETRIFDEEYDSGQPIKYYCDLLKKKPYFDNISRIILPHDAEVREQTSGKTRKEVFEEELPGITIDVLERSSIYDGIEAVRQMLVNMWIDAVKCPYLVSCFLNYSKEYDEKRNRWREKPKHDEYSNGADSIRYVAIGAEESTLSKPMPRRRGAGHDV
ncbi:MAG: hypothetical protein EOM35_02170 [Negativicutes bacterium]|nr:hypothetical protein [Negativicutes bacterium]